MTSAPATPPDSPPPALPGDDLQLRFHGRVLDHLGIQMYQSPVAAIAEMVSNAWDANAEEVRITLPSELGPDAEVVIMDDGLGMTWDECQGRFLNVGYNRRGGPSETTEGKQRPVMGRKGIGKFAGFGIAQVVEVDTTSQTTGERTVFALDLVELRGADTDEYIQTTSRPIKLISYLPPDPSRITSHGTTFRLRDLKMKQRPNLQQFAGSMARRFLVLQEADDFAVTIESSDGESRKLDDVQDAARVQFTFPSDYTEDELPPAVVVDADGWGEETLTTGELLRWRIRFYEETIKEQNLAGVSVFAHKKLAQVPFLFNLSGGLSGQQGVAYLAGQVVADFLDEQPEDLVATERQRLDWDHPDAKRVLDWGQVRVKELLRIWQNRRSEEKLALLKEKLAPFAVRLERLQRHERRVIEGALKALARISSLTTDQFTELATAVLTAWEGGRLRDLVASLDTTDDLTSDELVSLLLEANVLTALHTMEAVQTKVAAIQGLQQRISDEEFENPLRDYIAEHPWLISPELETFKKEIYVKRLMDEAAEKAGLTTDHAFNGRVDLAMSGGQTLLIIEFMRPGLTLDLDHIQRFDTYVRSLQVQVRATESARFNRVTGLLVADKVAKDPVLLNKLESLRNDGMDATDWRSLISRAKAQWEEFFESLATRAPEDGRVVDLKERASGQSEDSAEPPDGVADTAAGRLVSDD